MITFILAQIILGLPGAVATYLILWYLPEMPLLAAVVAIHIVQSVLIIIASIIAGPWVQKWLGIGDKMS